MKFTKATVQKALLLTTAFCFILLEQGYGQENEEDIGRIQTGRPDQTEGTTVVPKNTLQIETGIRFQRDSEEGREERTRSYPTAMFRYGLLETLELRLEGAYQDSVIREDDSRRTVRGRGPLDAGFRLYLWEGAGILPQAAFTGTVTLPVGNSSMTSGYADTELRLGFTNTITPDLSLTYTIGYGWVEEGNEIKYAFKVSGDLSYRIAVYGEVFGTNAEGSRAEHQADAGVLFIVRRNMQLDVAAGIALNQGAPDLFLTTGFSVRLPR